ncbi:hypothetical protein V7S43_009992 [Phytophthora oleae]|uniref:Uncharacterized protein n=1 Tax=Phytophthora oleae TaxID=2107226 RepID=A0ABD3FEK1_9STRA
MARLITGAKTLKVMDLITITTGSNGAVIFRPTALQLPLEGRQAHLLGEVCICICAIYPELGAIRRRENWLDVHHKLEDKHHVFEIDLQSTDTVVHSWGSHTTRANRKQQGEGSREQWLIC